MARTRWQDHVITDADLHHGDPCIRGTRVPIRTIIASLADGMRPEDILSAYPQLTPTSIRAALAYAADVLREESLIPLLSEAV